MGEGVKKFVVVVGLVFSSVQSPSILVLSLFSQLFLLFPLA